jgi:hypothetical protein
MKAQSLVRAPATSWTCFQTLPSLPLVANQSLYLNVYSFDYLELARLEEQKTCFNLVQDSRCLRIIPLTTPLEEQTDRNNINTVALEAMVAEALSASWDACLDDDGIL